MNVVHDTLESMRSGNFERNLPPDSYPEIAGLLSNATDKHDRKLCYWMLADVALATGSSEIGAFAVQRFAIETTAAFKKEALNVIQWTSDIKRYDELLVALQSCPRLTYDILKALGACVGQPAEAALLTVLRNAKQPRDVGNATNAVISLARMASADAVKQLSELFLNMPRKKSWGCVLAPSIFAFARHPSDLSTDLVRNEIVTTKIPQVAWAGLAYLAQYGTANDASVAGEYLASLLKRFDRRGEVLKHTITQLPSAYPTELSACVSILLAHAPASMSAHLPQLREHWQTLTRHDQSVLKEGVPDMFADLELSTEDTSMMSIS